MSWRRNGVVHKEEPEILWQDQDISIFSKGPGWIVAFSRGGEELKILKTIAEKMGHGVTVGIDSLINSGKFEHLCHYLRLKFKDQASFELADDPANECGIAHRLDVDTSGALMVAKTLKGFHHLRNLFFSQSVFKEYICLCHGSVKDAKGEINYSIAWDETNNTSYLSDKGLWAKTMYTVIGRYRLKNSRKVFTLCRVVIVTGRTHQIRVHMQSIGYPLVNDYKYNSKNANADSLWCPRMFLHSYRLRFDDTGWSAVEVKAPLTRDLQRALRTLEQVSLDTVNCDNPSCRIVAPVPAPAAASRPMVNGSTKRPTGEPPQPPPPPPAAPSAAPPPPPPGGPSRPPMKAPPATQPGHLEPPAKAPPAKRPAAAGRPVPGAVPGLAAAAGPKAAPAPKTSPWQPPTAGKPRGSPRRGDDASVAQARALVTNGCGRAPEAQKTADEPDGAHLALLLEMGFAKSSAIQALKANQNDVAEAMDQLAQQAAYADPEEFVEIKADAQDSEEDALRKAMELSQKEEEERLREHRALEAREDAALDLALAASQLDSFREEDEDDFLKALAASREVAIETQRRQALEDEEFERALQESVRQHELFHNCADDETCEELLYLSRFEAEAAVSEEEARLTQQIQQEYSNIEEDDEAAEVTSSLSSCRPGEGAEASGGANGSSSSSNTGARGSGGGTRSAMDWLEAGKAACSSSSSSTTAATVPPEVRHNAGDGGAPSSSTSGLQLPPSASGYLPPPDVEPLAGGRPGFWRRASGREDAEYGATASCVPVRSVMTSTSPGLAAGEGDSSMKQWFCARAQQLGIEFDVGTLWTIMDQNLSEGQLEEEDELKMWLGFPAEDPLPRPIFSLAYELRQSKMSFRYKGQLPR